MDELAIYNLSVKYPNTVDLVREVEKIAKAETIDKCIAIVSRNDCILEDYCNQQCVECICRRLKELKESQNES